MSASSGSGVLSVKKIKALIRNLITSESLGFDSSTNQTITGSWTFDISGGRSFGATDDATLAAPTALFGYFDEPAFAEGLIYISSYGEDSGYGHGFTSYRVKASGVSVANMGASSAGGNASVTVASVFNGDVSQVQLSAAKLNLDSMRYANLAAINAAITSPTTDDIVMVTGQGLAVYNGSDWVLAADDTTAIT